MLFGLYRALDSSTWPHQSPVWLFALFTITIVIPLLCMLSLEAENKLRAASYCAGFGALLTLLAVYTGYQTKPFQQFPITGLSLAFITSTALASFKALRKL